MVDFLTIILLIFGVLQIILFFKVWGMTNDIKEIRNKYLKDEDEKRRQKAEYDPTPKISGGGGRKINCVMRRFFPSSSVGDRPAPRGCTSTPDERKVTTI